MGRALSLIFLGGGTAAHPAPAAEGTAALGAPGNKWVLLSRQARVCFSRRGESSRWQELNAVTKFCPPDKRAALPVSDWNQVFSLENGSRRSTLQGDAPAGSLLVSEQMGHGNTLNSPQL